MPANLASLGFFLRPIAPASLQLDRLSQRFYSPGTRRGSRFPLLSNLPRCRLPSFSKALQRRSSSRRGNASATASGLPMAEDPSASDFPTPSTLQAVLFDVDGTLADSDPLHFLAFREMLKEVGFRGGVPIDEEFFRVHISGRHNPDIGADLFPEWSEDRRNTFLEDKEERFRRLASEKLQEVVGLQAFCRWIETRNLRRAAVTNAPRKNAEQMIRALGLADFFEILVIGSECERAKPFPDPYLVALKHLGVSPRHAFAVEDSPAGARSAMAAGLPTVGILTGQEKSVLEKAGTSFTIRDFEDPLLWKAIGSPKSPI